jgi:hypothetical protein
VRVSDLTKLTAAQALAILSGYVRAMTPKDGQGQARPSWPRRVAAHGGCFYAPHCSESHHFLTCPTMRSDYRAGAVKLICHPRRDGTDFTFDIYQHASYLQLVADNLNDGVMVPKSSA